MLDPVRKSVISRNPAGVPSSSSFPPLMATGFMPAPGGATPLLHHYLSGDANRSTVLRTMSPAASSFGGSDDLFEANTHQPDYFYRCGRVFFLRNYGTNVDYFS